MAVLLHPQSHEILSTLLKASGIQQYLTSLKEHHLETYQHSLRVGLLCLDLGLEWHLKPPELNILGVAGLLHDIGKQRIPKEILSKTSSLNDQEKEVMRKHPRLGFLELEGSEYEVARKVVIAHHEFKVNPYPRQGNDRSKRKRTERRSRRALIDELSQIVCVADIFDALASRRAYKAPMSKEEIEGRLRTQFTGDEHLIEVILQRCEEGDSLEEASRMINEMLSSKAFEPSAD
jgi:HD-GYP domain-containing protein (c-di-GMP phosphodiesterase class II)